MQNNMMYVCNDCGIKFDEPAQWQESRGEYWGTPAYETTYGCPICHGYFDVVENDEEIEGTEDECGLH